MVRVLVLAAAACVACGEELSASVREKLRGEAPFGSEIINIPGSTAPGSSISFSDGFVPSKPSSTGNVPVDPSTIIPGLSANAPLYCMGTCPTKVDGQQLPPGSTQQVTVQGVQLCVPAGVVVAPNGTISLATLTIYTPGVSPNNPCPGRATALAPAILAVVGVLVSMLL